jgi:CRISPR-associated protein Cas2
MFVSIALDPGSESRAKELADLLAQYGFEKVQRGLWESAFVSPETLVRLKRDMDHSTDAFDRVRFFQFPIEGTLVLTSLRDKKWRRMVARGEKAAPSQKLSKPSGRNERTAQSARNPRGKSL